MGPQAVYVEKVKAWYAFHDLLSNSNSKKLWKKLRGTILKSQFYGLAKDIIKSVPQGKLSQNNGCEYVINSIKKGIRVLFVSHVCINFNLLLPLRRKQDENMRNFESRIKAQNV